MTIKSSLKQISKYILLSLLFITVPLSFQPTIAGALFAHFHDQKVKDGIKAYAAELDSLSWIMQYSIPGAKSILEHLDNASPFFVDQLRHAHWGEKLGMTQPYLRDFGDETPVDRFASFEGMFEYVFDVTLP